MVMASQLKRRYAVIGNPVSHSKSPLIHRQFAAQFGIALEYRAMEAPLRGFAAAVARFAAEGGHGLNVTVPFKHEAFTLAAHCTPRAQRAGAVNTLTVAGDGVLAGDNTDGAGLVRDLCHNHGVAVAGQRLLIIGAGGAVRGILGPLLDERPAAVHVVNRTAAKAAALAAAFDEDRAVVQGGGYDAARERYDLVLHASAAGLHGQAPPLPEDVMAPGALAYDLVYGDEETAFLRWARATGAARAADGIGMLVEQAAVSFAGWHGEHPDTAAVIAALGGERRERG